MQVHIDRGGQRFGPYSIDQVNAYLADGSLLATDLGWTDGMTDWLPLPKVPGVIAVEAAPPPAAPPAEESALPSPEPTACDSRAKSVASKKLMIGIGAGVGVLALAAAGYFVVYPKLTGDGSDQLPEESSDGGNTAMNPPMGEPMAGPPPSGGFSGRPNGNPQGGFQGGSQGRPKGGGFNLMARLDKDRDGRLSRTEFPPQMMRMFDQLDKNRDGFVDQNEMRSMAGMMGGGKGRPQGGFGGQGRPQGGFGGQGRPPQGGGPAVDPTTGLPLGTGQGRPQPRKGE